MFRVLLVVFGIAVVSLLGVGMIDENMRAAEKAETNEPSAKSSAGTRMVVLGARDGHFAAEGRVDGRPLLFMVDTGASQIALRASDAARLGYRPRPQDYTVRVSTANGEGRAARVELGRVEVGEIMVRDVAALVVSDDALGVNLLGMSFLSRVRWHHEQGRLVIEQ
jgi:aspartyl protease family protein